ncbi:hypothetical protein M3M33_16690, partial [Loigolactobacillus coryniformis]|uniref:hypothetical protein n=1 Tax=Loigolactobacillus coryniformis TaxID=1610 RepID=UPI00201AD532
AQADHIAEVEARTAKANAVMAAEKDAMDFIVAKAKEAGITLPDGLVGAKKLGKYVEERLKLKNAASKEALENPNAYQNEP